MCGGEIDMSNLSQIKRDRMINFIEKKKETFLEDADIKAINEIENYINDKRYGLIWEEHIENVDVDIENNIPVFKEDPDRKIIKDDQGKMNFLIEGDNLHSLYLLEKTHKGKIDVIYIDPPYNTNNSLTYDDTRVGKEDEYRHSKWLSFIDKRIKVAKRLLTDDGVIFVSIDDNEYAAMKLLLDSIFGENNFVVGMPRQTKRSGKTTDSFAKNHDYVLVYTNLERDVFEKDDHVDEGFKFSDKHVETRGKYKLNQTLDYDSLSYSPSLDYPIELDGETFYPGGDYEAYKKRKLGEYKRADWAWRWSKELFQFGLENDFIVVKERQDGTGKRIYTKTYLNAKIERLGSNEFEVVEQKRKKSISSLDLAQNQYSNDNAKKDLARFGLQSNFDYAKPVELIKRLIKTHSNKDAIVLDFFAGSGTTAEATLLANAEDDGNRTFIICTNNENKIIDEVTYPRVSALFNGYKTRGKQVVTLFEENLTVTRLKNIDKIFEQIEELEQKNKDKYGKLVRKVKDNKIMLIGENKNSSEVRGISANLKYFKTAFVPRFSESKTSLSHDLLEYVRAMVEINYGTDLASSENVKLLFTEEELDSFFDNNAGTNITLFIPNSVLLMGKQEYIAEKQGIAIVRIPDYYFSNELMEAGEL